MTRPLVLGIETSCDDTACALVDGDGRVVASVVSSQLAAHRPYGGVVPEIASREHLANWSEVAGEAFASAGATIEEVDVVAATRGPGLVGALLVGLSLGRAIAWARGLPFHAVHHLEGHVFSPWLAPTGEAAEPVPERFVALVVSGGHTSLYGVDGAAIATLAETRDDAFGEAFDKLGKRLGLPYPQGPRLDELAERGDAAASPLPRLAGTEELFFSYSGLKTQAVVELERLERAGVATAIDPASDPPLAPAVLDLVAGFRDSAVRQILDRLTRLHRRAPFATLAVSGGAAANRELRRRLPGWAAERGVELRLVPLVYAGDNAAMIAFAALRRERLGRRDDPLAAEAASRVPIGA
ncbi:MAG TPA: tRNA (adenosine(37)-N6)-threonylcarbamoyltransferase complex transferase subunit TsaD [Thermoanaerobaculia bacterium]|nr:tRNA (adenosine(37)-N6)-threonylcarbamoyltransferase complex transferase subunit TsaD [Thermoanaerobaculia bacterium]